MPEFVYSPLKAPEFRLLRLRHDEPSSLMRCDLRTAVIASPEYPPYTAISYCWGDPTAIHPILVNGQDFKVTQSVHDLFTALLSKSIGWMWIDAICINQSDNEEKSWHVGYMGQVYSNAKLCRIWLGVEAEGSQMAISFLRAVRLDLLEASSVTEKRALIQGPNAQNSHDKWQALIRLFERQWFYRIWTIQEAVLSTDVLFHCGSEEISFFEVFEVFEQLDSIDACAPLLPEIEHPFDSNEMPRAHSRMRLIIFLKHFISPEGELHKDNFGLEKVIALTDTAHSTNPRDYIYGIFGIVLDATDEELKPNYNASVQDVYIKTTRHIMNRNNSLKLLAEAGVCSPNRLNVPSWVPNYNVPSEGPSLGLGNYRASGNKLPVLEWDSSTDDLTARGIHLDYAFSSCKHSMTKDGLCTVNDIRAWYEEAYLFLSVCNLLPEYDTKHTLKVFWTTLTLGLTLDKEIEQETTSRRLRTKEFISLQLDRLALKFPYFGFPSRNTDETSAAYNAFHKFITNLEDFAWMLEEEWGYLNSKKRSHLTIAKQAYRFRRLSSNAWYGRKLAVTQNGRLAFVPLATEAGDRISILLGANAPFVFRPGEQGSEFEGKFRLVGECYVYGLMDGEGLELGDVEDVTIY
ncbi:hypothetical protein VTL71DRAFT_3587 [Oculimacula yallundae]|uniref:Heterokaryon incompatibility domain-containing protein n=1 Tax=Oculimacula yallundae TaxID=86028 RepID=A0ABR4C7L4_9HELO